MPQPVRKKKTIVCALDLAPAARMEAAWSVFLADRLEADLILFHAVAMPADPLDPFERDGSFEKSRNESRLQIEQIMRDPEKEVSWNILVAGGDPAETLHQYCLENRVDLVVVGSRGFKGVKRLLLGTVVERLSHVSVCPLLVLRNPQRAPKDLSHIGICCDFKADNSLLFHWGREIARLLNARIHLLHAMQSAVDASVVDPTEAPYWKAQQMLHQRLENRLRSLYRSTDPAPARPEVKVHIIHDSARDGLLDLLHGLSIDLVVLGSHRHSALEKLMIGSTTDAMLRGASCDILVVPIPFLSAGSPEAPGRAFP